MPRGQMTATQRQLTSQRMKARWKLARHLPTAAEAVATAAEVVATADAAAGHALRLQ